MYDLIIRGGTLVDAHLNVAAEIAITAGEIVEIAPTISGNCADEIDATGFVIFPGGIDPHVHFHEALSPQTGGLYTGTRALAAGGITTFFDMPFTPNHVTDSVTALEAKRQAMRRSALVKGHMWAALTSDNHHEIEALHQAGAIGFTALMAAPSEAVNLPVVDDDALYEGMKAIAALDGILALHTENHSITQRRAARALASDKNNAEAYQASRPVIAELEAIDRAISFSRETGCKIHILHVSSGRAIKHLLRARADGVNVTWATNPHYLIFSESDMEWLNVRGKCTPPLRCLNEQALLWDYLLEGELPIIASDHAPVAPENRPEDDFFNAWSGIASCQEMLRLLLTEGYHRRGMLLQQIAAVTAYNTAQRFGLKSKGRLVAGAEADLVLVDVEAADVLHANDLHYQHKISPYIGMKLNGRIARTLVNGRTVYSNGAFS